jgi:hypothetical protein
MFAFPFLRALMRPPVSTTTLDRLSGSSPAVGENLADDQALSEGWGVFDCGCRDDGSARIELQRIDSPTCGTPHFQGDDAAWQHVVQRARAGSMPHQRALQMVDPVERLAIETKCGWCPGL